MIMTLALCLKLFIIKIQSLSFNPTATARRWLNPTATARRRPQSHSHGQTAGSIPQPRPDGGLDPTARRWLDPTAKARKWTQSHGRGMTAGSIQRDGLTAGSIPRPRPDGGFNPTATARQRAQPHGHGQTMGSIPRPRTDGGIKAPRIIMALIVGLVQYLIVIYTFLCIFATK